MCGGSRGIRVGVDAVGRQGVEEALGCISMRERNSAREGRHNGCGFGSGGGSTVPRPSGLGVWRWLCLTAAHLKPQVIRVFFSVWGRIRNGTAGLCERITRTTGWVGCRAKVDAGVRTAGRATGLVELRLERVRAQTTGRWRRLGANRVNGSASVRRNNLLRADFGSAPAREVVLNRGGFGVRGLGLATRLLRRVLAWYGRGGVPAPVHVPTPAGAEAETRVRCDETGVELRVWGGQSESAATCRHCRHWRHLAAMLAAPSWRQFFASQIRLLTFEVHKPRLGGKILAAVGGNLPVGGNFSGGSSGKVGGTGGKSGGSWRQFRRQSEINGGNSGGGGGTFPVMCHRLAAMLAAVYNLHGGNSLDTIQIASCNCYSPAVEQGVFGKNQLASAIVGHIQTVSGT
ncbi:hypothetical protein C8R43DRAFT_1189561 [Mycena crocata]|nr:hypothetical protein C8R43DRAFT_1189561 [Mycena crocata]